MTVKVQKEGFNLRDKLKELEGNKVFDTLSITGSDANSILFLNSDKRVVGDASILSVDASGNVGIGASSPTVRLDVSGAIRASTGILFGTDTAAANTLDDYEEGTWTPTLGGDATYTVQEGTYTKIGDTVYIKGAIRPNVLGTGSVNTITGLPFAPVSGYDSGADVGLFDFMPSNVIAVGGAVYSAGIIFYAKATASQNYVGVNVFADGGGRIRFSATYKTLG